MQIKRAVLTGLLAVFALALIVAVTGYGQSVPGTSYVFPTFVPTLTVLTGNTSTGSQSITVDYGYSSFNGVTFYPLAVGQVVTVGMGATADSVTISAVTCPTPAIYGSCSFTATSYSYAHGRGDPIKFAALSAPVKLEGSCSGVATASQTLGLYGLGQYAALTCDQTAYTLGPVMSQPGVIRFLGVAVSPGGTTGASGVFTVQKNGSDTTSTCTVGTSTTCSDSTHFVSFVAGDVIAIKFTTQGSETLANVKAYVLAY